jgi:hypothetical protein
MRRVDEWQALTDAWRTLFTWPAVAALLALSQRQAIARLIDRVRSAKIGKDGAQFDTSELTRTAREVVEAQRPGLPSDPSAPATVTPSLAEQRTRRQALESLINQAVYQGWAWASNSVGDLEHRPYAYLKWNGDLPEVLCLTTATPASRVTSV